jgi:hypothetical protein
MKKLRIVWLLLWLPLIAFAQLEETQVVISDGLSNDYLKQKIEMNISHFLVACNKAVMDGKKPKLNHVMTDAAQETLEQMWKTSPMVCPVSKVEEICLETSGGGYQIRNVPISMMAADEDKKEQELVFTMTSSGLIDNISIAIDEHKYKEIMDEHESVEDLFRRQVIIDFIESYRTSYNRKDLEYIESVFSDNALIITGKVVREKPNSDHALRSLSHEKIVYQKRNKKQYIENLKKVFSGNKYINVVFDEVEVIQHPKLTDIYGVTLKQEWNTNRYSDVGFIFLMIDFQDENHPLIQVRTWQPEKLNGKVLAREEVFSLGHFTIARSIIND